MAPGDFGGVTMDRTIQVACDDPIQPEQPVVSAIRSRAGIPWLINVKWPARCRCAYGISIGVAFQSYRYLIGGATISNTTAAYGDPVADHADDPIRRELPRAVHARARWSIPA